MLALVIILCVAASAMDGCKKSPGVGGDDSVGATDVRESDTASDRPPLDSATASAASSEVLDTGGTATASDTSTDTSGDTAWSSAADSADETGLASDSSGKREGKGKGTEIKT